MDSNHRIRELDRQIVKFNLVSMPATIAIGLGLYGIFGANGNAFHPLLDNSTFVKVMLGVGVGLELWVLTQLIPLFRARAALVKK